MQNLAFSPFNIVTDDGLTLYGRSYGTGSDRPPIVCLAGLSRNSRDFHQFALRLSAGGERVITLDYRGRGLSDWDPNRQNYNVGREAQDVIQALDQLDVKTARFVGTSRGGLILHILGAIAPKRIAALVFNDIGPVIEMEGLRHIRDYLSIRNAVATYVEAASHLKSTHGQEFPALQDPEWLIMAEAIYRERGDRFAADFDPALVEPLKAMDFDKPLPDLWPQFDALREIPLLIVRGENSKLLSRQTVEEMVRRHPNAIEVAAKGQGHAPVLHVDPLFGRIADFLAET